MHNLINSLSRDTEDFADFLIGFAFDGVHTSDFVHVLVRARRLEVFDAFVEASFAFCELIEFFSFDFVFDDEIGRALVAIDSDVASAAEFTGLDVFVDFRQTANVTDFDTVCGIVVVGEGAVGLDDEFTDSVLGRGTVFAEEDLTRKKVVFVDDDFSTAFVATAEIIVVAHSFDDG